MTMTENSEELPRSADELAELAAYYDTHDTSAEMEDGQLVVEQTVYGAHLVDHDELAQINERLARIEAAMARQSHDAA